MAAKCHSLSFYLGILKANIKDCVGPQDMSIEEFFGNGMKSKDLSPEERIRFFKNNYFLSKYITVN